MARCPDQGATPGRGISGDRLVRSAHMVECSEGNREPSYLIQAASGCRGCAGSCGWHKHFFREARLLKGVAQNPDRQNLGGAVLLAVSRRGLSLASGLVFGVPLLTFIVAALVFDGRLGELSAGAASFGVLVFSLGCIGVAARSHLTSFDGWLQFELTDLQNDLDTSDA
ncbi:MAG: SoxR reducing system RseC family protein [Gammaproteobacteria bacterium]|nr:SoxR reducing system RseC family protein [Gammaproteobacteria bacterium]